MKKLAISLPVILLIFACVFCSLFGVGALSVYNRINTMRSEVIARETALNRQYLVNQTELSTYITSFYEQIGIANLKSDQLDRIISDAIKGRYEGDTTANPGGGQMFSAIQEAYPELDLELYDEILAFVQEKRDAYKDAQNALLTMLADYDQFRKQDIIGSLILRNIIGVPTDALEARIGSQVWHGQAALDHMYLIVLDSKTIEAYETGVLDPLEIPTIPPRGTPAR